MPTNQSFKFFTLTCFCLFWLWSHSYAQLSADFTSNTTSGCAPLQVVFQDLSTGTGISSRKWVFGNGNISLGNQISPSAIYQNPGTYTVKLVITNSSGADSITKTNYIQVFAPPVVDFTASNTTDCAPLPVAFNDISTAASAIVQRKWDFGDGTPPFLSNTAALSHTYANGGVFSVVLQITDANGCSAFKNKPNLVNAFFQPEAIFEAAGNVSSCTPPLQVAFDNTSTGSAPLYYNWTLGNGQTSSLQNPITTYSNYGYFDVRLIVTNSFGCKDTLFRDDYIKINVLTAGISAPDTVCMGELVTILDNSTAGNQFNWSLGNFTSSSGNIVTTTYYNPGLYTIALETIVDTGCVDTATKQIYVREFIANFTTSSHYACEAPTVFQYAIDPDPDIVTAYWDLGNDSNYTGLTASSTFITPGTYNDVVIVEDRFGCTDTLVANANIIIDDFQISINALRFTGCAPAVMNFDAYVSNPDSAASYFWDFGNGLTDTMPNTSTLYPTDSVWTLTLTVTHASGCIYEYSKVVTTGLIQNALFSVDTTLLCASDSFQFINSSTDTTLIDSYTWSFGSQEYEPLYAFSDTGYMDVSLIVGYHGCYDTLLIQDMVYVLGPVTGIGINFSCDSLLEPTLTGTALDGNRFYWDFGDGSPLDSVNLNLSHLYPSRGFYNASLTAYNDTNNCSYFFNQEIYLFEPQAVITASDTVGCDPLFVSFSGLLSQDALFYNWGFENVWLGQEVLGDTTYTFNNPGIKTAQLEVIDANGCPDTTTIFIKVSRPIPDFTAIPTSGCSPLNVDFTSLATSDTTITYYKWFMGDGTLNYQQNPNHTYYMAGSGKYTVSLFVKDAIGCSDIISKTHYIQVFQPDVEFTTNDSITCPNQTVQFTAINPNTQLLYAWDYGNGLTSVGPTGTSSYTGGGYYYPTLTAIDTNGCDSSFVMPILVEGFPNLNITTDKTDTACYPATFTFTDSSGYSYVDYWTWDFGDSTSFLSNSNQVYHTYTSPGIYSLWVYLYSNLGCVDSSFISNFVTINGPYADIDLLDDTLCLGEEAIYNFNNPTQLAYYAIDYGDGYTSNDSTVLINSNEYASTGTFYPFIILYDSSKTCLITQTDTIFVQQVISNFNTDTFQGCPPLNIVTTSGTTGATSTTWYVNGIAADTGNVANITLQNPGNNIISQLNLNDSTQCKDSTFKLIYVFPFTEAKTSANTLICVGDTTTINASGGVKYTWNYNATLESDSTATTRIWPSTETKYTVEVTDTNQCKDTASVLIKVQQIPILNIDASDSVVFLGQEAFFDIYTEQGNSVTISPNTFRSCYNCNPIALLPRENTTYTITVADPNGCFVIDTSIFIRVEKDRGVYIPNAFTPNNDGQNDKFFVITYGYKKLVSFQIFDRWGDLIFETNDIKVGWDGHVRNFKQEVAASEVFTYKVQVLGYDEVVDNFVGKVLVIK